MRASDDLAQNCTGTVTELEFVPKFGTLYPEFFFSSLNHPKLQSMEAQVSFALSLGLSDVWSKGGRTGIQVSARLEGTSS